MTEELTLGKTMDENLQGIWAFRRDADDKEEWILQVFPDGRLAQFYKQHPSLTKYVCMTMLAEPKSRDSFRVKTTSEATGYLIDMRRDGANLVVTNKGRPFVCPQLSNEEIPSWLEELRSKAVWRESEEAL